MLSINNIYINLVYFFARLKLIPGPKDLLLILGMHRSGTSALTGSLVNIGYFAGNKLLEASVYNEKGFFEDRDIIWINDLILNYNNLSWYNYNGQILKYSNHHFRKLVVLLLLKYCCKRKVIIKDPRISLLMPVYTKAFMKLGWEYRFIEIQRNDKSIIDSINNRNRELRLDNITELIRHYYKSIDLYSGYNKKLVLKFEDLVNQNIGTYNQLIDFLNLSENEINIIRNFFDSRLKNH
jgi:hypothetical protein